MVERLGFACKWLDDPSETANMKINARNRELNTGTTTVAWLNRQTRQVAEQRLWDLMVHNIQANVPPDNILAMFETAYACGQR